MVGRKKILEIQRQNHVLARIPRRIRNRHFGETQLILSLADQRFNRRGRDAKEFGSHCIEAVIALSRIYNIAGHHGVKRKPAHGDAVVPEDLIIVFEVLADLGDCL